MEIFKGENLLEFTSRFDSDESCKIYLAGIKWENGFVCTKCGHDKSQIRKDYSRTCNKCSHTESPTAGTLFHKVKFGLKKAFHIAFELCACTRGISSSQLAKRYGISYCTAWLFAHKVRLGMKSSCSMPMEGRVHVDEFVMGGKEEGKQGRSYDTKKKKVVCAVELTKEDKVKRIYALVVPDYSSKSLRTIFDKHISKQAQVTTDEWKGYKPIKKDYAIEQIPSNSGQNFKAMHTMIHQIKGTVRAIHSYIAKGHTDSYPAEHCFRVNRSIFKETIFHSLVSRMVMANPSSYQKIICT